MNLSLAHLRASLGIPEGIALIEIPGAEGPILAVNIGPETTERGVNPAAWLEFALEGDGMLLAPRGQRMRLPLPVLAHLIKGIFAAGLVMTVGWIAVHGARDTTVPAGRPAESAWDAVIIGWQHVPIEPLESAASVCFTINVPNAGPPAYQELTLNGGLSTGSVTFDGEAEAPESVENRYGYGSSRPASFWLGGLTMRPFRLPPQAYVPEQLDPRGGARSKPATHHPLPHGYATVVPALSPPLEPRSAMCPRADCGVFVP